MARSATLRAGVLCLTLIPAAFSTSHAQGVRLQYTPVVGQVTRYKIVGQAWPTGDTTAAAMTTTMYQTQTILSMDGPNYVIRTVMDSTISSAGARDMMRGMAITTHVDPRGQVLSSEVTPPPGLPPFIANMLTRNNGQSSGGNRQAVMPDRPLNVGDTWTDSVTSSMGGGRGQRPQQVTYQVTYKLERVDGRVATISMNGTVQGGASGTMAGEMTLDLGAGRLTHMESTSAFQAQGGGGTARSKSTMDMLP
jgi:hypothetical protein